MMLREVTVPLQEVVVLLLRLLALRRLQGFVGSASEHPSSQFQGQSCRLLTMSL